MRQSIIMGQALLSDNDSTSQGALALQPPDLVIDTYNDVAKCRSFCSHNVESTSCLTCRKENTLLCCNMREHWFNGSAQHTKKWHHSD
jgi:hypothetical protein